MQRLKSPTSALIREARLNAKHTQKTAAETVYRAADSRWREWESGRHRMDMAVWELYLIKTNQLQNYLEITDD